MHETATYIVQVGAARLAVQAFLSPQVGQVYTPFAKQQLTAQVSSCNAGPVFLEYCAALASLVNALPSEQAPADMRIQRSTLWPGSQPQLLPSPTDIVTPLPQDGASTAGAATAAVEAAVHSTENRAEAALGGEAAPAASPSAVGAAVVLTRLQAFQRCDYLVKPVEGLVWAVLGNSSKPAAEHQAALNLLTVVYQSKSSTIMQHAEQAAYCCRFHFTAMSDAYRAGNAGLCRQHVKALQALAQHKVGCIKHCSALNGQLIATQLAQY